MLRIIESFGNLPTTIDVDSDIKCQPGQIGSLKIKNNKSVIGICDGLHPFGIIDDLKSNTIRSVVSPKDGEFIIPITEFEYDSLKKEIVLSKDFHVELKHTNIISSSFISNINVELNCRNGIVTIPKGTTCNYCINITPNQNDMINHDIRLVVKYAYNTIYDSLESTISNMKITMWTKNMICETDMFDTSAKYEIYSNLYIINGLLTTKCILPQCKCVGMVLSLPTVNNNMLRILWDPDHNIQTLNKG